MRLLDHTFATPAENLACDEALLDACEAGGPEALRFWESPAPFVVVGYSNQVEREVKTDACRRLGVPVLRRCSGGGTVVQGPGCLNYAVVASVKKRPTFVNITATNDTMMKIHRDVFRPLLGPEVQVQGHTDLALGALKFSGNSQRRRRNSVLFHGTFLLDFDLPLIETLLHSPSRQPEYRNHRKHQDFVTNVAIPAGTVKAALARAWNAEGPAEIPAMAALVRRYASDSWNRKF